MRFRTTLGAARELAMSQPGVSNAIKHMEAQLGFQLFDRIRNRLEPTEEARILVKDAEPLFLMHRVIRQKAIDLKAGRAGRLRLLATSEVSDALLPSVIARFVPRHPDVKISLEVLSLDQVLEGIELGIGDIGFAMEPYPRPTVVCKPLAWLDMVCACPPGSSLAALPDVTPKDMRGQTLIVAPPAGSRINSLIAAAFEDAGEPFHPNIEVRFMNVAARLVERGVGVAIIDRLTATSITGGGLRVCSFSPHLTVAVYSILANGKPTSRTTSAFIEYAQTEGEQGVLRNPAAHV
jgi:DNA-binding transcriptional LysR family regulator